MLDANSCQQMGIYMATHDAESPQAPPAKPRLLDLAREAIRRRHYSYRTEETYLQWMKRFILFSGKRHPRGVRSPLEQFV